MSPRIASPARVVRRLVCPAALAVAALLVGVLALTAPARAAFPGRNGLLAVQPLRGPGIVLINANGRGGRLVCAQPGDRCGVTSPGRLLRPQWAPDGATLVIENVAGPSEGWFEVIYPDGSCLDCLNSQSGAWVDAAFTSNPTLLTALGGAGGDTPDGLVEYGVDGLRRRVLVRGAVSDPVWSSRGELALVRGGWIWVGSPGRLRRITRGRALSWSPDGRRIVFVRRGWLLVGAVRGRSFRRLVRGADPTWSPDGGAIAFFDKHHWLKVVSATGGRVHRVGRVTGWTVDWQPLPATGPAPCLTPSGSTVLAASDTAIITESHGQSIYPPYSAASAEMGCLRADGRERVLFTSAIPGYSTGIGPTEIALAGPYAAFAGTTLNSHDQSITSVVNLVDLRTGLPVPGRAGSEVSMCLDQSTPPCASTVDQLVLGSDAVSAVHTTVTDANCAPIPKPNCMYTVEQIQAIDGTGVHTLDSAAEPDGSAAALTDLVLTGDTLTWNDNGIQHSAQLQP